MPSMNLLGDNYLGSEYSITEARIIFEIYENQGINAARIAKIMNIDKSYLSRMIKNHERNGYIMKSASKEDGRSYCLYLTEKGNQKAKDFIKKSDEEIRIIIKSLTKDQQKSLIDALDVITELLSLSEVEAL